MPAPTEDHHAALHDSFRWQVPRGFNWAEACCGRWARDAATRNRRAIVHQAEDGSTQTLSYAELQANADRLSHALERLGAVRGDRIAIVMPQRPETAVAHLAVQQLGAVAVPLSVLFGPEALQHRLADCGARFAFADGAALTALREVRGECPALEHLIVADEPAIPGEAAWHEALAREPAAFTPAFTGADEPAAILYTSGTTGPPKGALIPQRALIGNLTGFVCSQNWFPVAQAAGAPGATRDDERADDAFGADRAESPAPCVFWSPADWAWTGGLMDALLPTLYFGQTVVGSAGRFDAVRAFELMQRHRVTHAFLFPTALKAMMKAVPAPRDRYVLALQAVMSAGEAVGDASFAWSRDALGVPVNEMFGQTEINYVVGNCARWVDAQGTAHPGWPARAGSMGRAYPGHRVAVIDDDGHEQSRGTPGDVAVHRRDVHGHPDPVFFNGYWRHEDATRAKFTGDPEDSWCRTGDTAVMDADGYLWYQGRSDDVFKVAGYRIGPSEIENCLVKHPAVANAAVVPKPDAERGAVVKAYVVLAHGHDGTAELIAALQDHVRERLAPYEYPKEIEFIDALPMTTTGKVQRRVLRLQEAARAARG